MSPSRSDLLRTVQVQQTRLPASVAMFWTNARRYRDPLITSGSAAPPREFRRSTKTTTDDGGAVCRWRGALHLVAVLKRRPPTPRTTAGTPVQVVEGVCIPVVVEGAGLGLAVPQLALSQVADPAGGLHLGVELTAVDSLRVRQTRQSGDLPEQALHAAEGVRLVRDGASRHVAHVCPCSTGVVPTHCGAVAVRIG